MTRAAEYAMTRGDDDRRRYEETRTPGQAPVPEIALDVAYRGIRHCPRIQDTRASVGRADDCIVGAIRKPIENERNFLDVSADIMEHVDPIFFGDPKTAANKVMGG